MKKEFVVERNGKSFVLYAGLLDLAHEQGLKAITTTLVQVPAPDNGLIAIAHATVETTKGMFTGLGDAGPESVSRMMLPHTIRLAETRAKARALRDAVNVGMAALEELGADGAGDSEEDEPRSAAPRRGGSWGGVPAAGAPELDEDGFQPGPGPRTPAQRSYGSDSSVAGADAATPKQVETIRKMSRGTMTAERMTRAEASKVISELIEEMNSNRG